MLMRCLQQVFFRQHLQGNLETSATLHYIPARPTCISNLHLCAVDHRRSFASVMLHSVQLLCHNFATPLNSCGDKSHAKTLNLSSQELDRIGQARSIMFPKDHPTGSSRDPEDPTHHLYVASHGAYAAGEQRHRHYDWDQAGVDPATHSFGEPS